MSRSQKDIVIGVMKKDSSPNQHESDLDENVTSARSELLTKFYKSRGWNVDYITKNKKVAQSKTNEFIKWKNDHGYMEEVEPIEELSTELLGKYKAASSKQASELDKAGGKKNIEKANKRFGGIIKATNKQFVNDLKTEEVTESQKLTRLLGIVKEAHNKNTKDNLYGKTLDDKNAVYGKKPLMQKTELVDDRDKQEINSRMVLKGGTTLTGKSRDTVQIDPMLSQRNKIPDNKKSNQEKQ